jgi:S-sulfosulfanyl-L-cysteine sulfohydrolase
MSLSRREFVQVLGLAAAAGMTPNMARGQGDSLYDLGAFGNTRLLHFTDCHAQLNPIYFREPSVNIGLGGAHGKAPHLVGQHLLDRFQISAHSLEAHALTYLNFTHAAKKFGKLGGFAHLATLINRLRAEVPDGASLLLDGGDTWQGSWTALQTRGRDMVGAANLLGVDIMTGHWEFTYKAEEVLANMEALNGEFLAQNVRVKEDALFDGAAAFDEDSGHALKPWTIREVGGNRVAIIGQAFPYTPIANPQRFIPDWTFGIRESELQELVTAVRDEERPDALVMLSHNGMDVDLKLASRVRGIDAILGGHTHDGVPTPTIITNPGGQTLVTNAGSNGKFLGVLDLDIGKGKVRGYRYKLLPIFANLLEADASMQSYIDGQRAPHLAKLNEELATAGSVLYRRGNFMGSFDQVICDALLEVNDAEVALSPGFRWGTTVLPGDTIRYEDLLDQTAMTYPETYARDMSGEDLKLILEDVADNLFNPDPYYQQGGDMVRVGGLAYSIEPGQKIGARISDMQLTDGTSIEASKTYRVAGWATVGSTSPGPPVWEQVAQYLRAKGEVHIDSLNAPRVKNLQSNPGYSNDAG